MKNMKKVPWHIIISAMILTMLVLATSKVFAHGEGRCFTSASRNTFLRNGSFMKVVDHLEDAELRRLQGGLYKHGHRNQYYDRNGNPTTPSTAFFDIDGLYDDDELYVDCPTASQPPSTTLQRNPVNSCDPEPISLLEADYSCEMLGYELGVYCYDLDLTDSPWVSIPVISYQTETVADLWRYVRDTVGHEIDIRLLVNSIWSVYKGEDDNELGDVEISPYLGLNIHFKGVIGIPGMGFGEGDTVMFNAPIDTLDIHLLGFSVLPVGYEHLSDLLIDGVDFVKRRVRVDGNLFYKTITRENIDSEYDVLIEPGMAVMIRIREAVTFDLSGSDVLMAPMARRVGTLATSWGAMKR